MASPARVDKMITLEEFLRMPEIDEHPYLEYIDGRIEAKVSPQKKHGLLEKRLYDAHRRLRQAPDLGETFPELRCTFAGRSIIPDVVFLLDEHIETDEDGVVLDPTLRPPDLHIEIVSPDQSVRKCREKLVFSTANGCPLGWLIDPNRMDGPGLSSGSPPEASYPAEGVLEGDPVLPGVSPAGRRAVRLVEVAAAEAWASSPPSGSTEGEPRDDHPRRVAQRPHRSQPLRLLFDAGTLVVEGLREDDERSLPGVKFDPRTRQFRAEAIWYRTIVEQSAATQTPYQDAARAYEPTPWRLQVAKDAFPHQVEGLNAWWQAGGRGVVVLPTGTGKTHLANLCHRAGRPAHPGHHAHHRPDEPVVRRAEAQLRRRGRPTGRRLLRHPAADRDDLRFGLPEHGPPRQPVRLHRLRRMPSPPRPDLRPGRHLRHRPLPPGTDRHARARRQRPHAPGSIDRSDRLPPRDHPAPRPLPGRLPRDDLVCPVERRRTAAVRAGARDLSRVRPRHAAST